jgi:hypothetical protein
MSAFSSGDTTTQTSAARLGLKERQLELTKFLTGDDPLGMSDGYEIASPIASMQRLKRRMPKRSTRLMNPGTM